MSDPEAEESYKAWAALKQRQGRMHEDAALETIGGDAVNLDDFVKQHANDATPASGDRKYQGGRHPTYDITSSTELASVKSHMSGGAKPSDQDVANYLHDFEKMRGYGGRSYARGLSPIEQDVEAIKQARDQGAPVPPKLVGKSDAEIQKYLEDETVMRIPEDHVPQVCEAFAAKVKQFPQEYGFSENATDDEVNDYAAKRWQSTGLSAAETQERLRTEGLLADEEVGKDVGEASTQEQTPALAKGSSPAEDDAVQKSASAQEPDAAKQAQDVSAEQETSRKSKGYGMGM